MRDRRSRTLRPVRAVFLDRDGVINRKQPEGEYVTCWEEFEILDGALEAIKLVNEAGLLAVVVTNQRGIALGRMSEDDLENIHRNLRDRLEAIGGHVDAFYHCPHDLNACDCRKPD